MKVALVTILKDERPEDVEAFFHSLALQTRKPDEIFIIDSTRPEYQKEVWLPAQRLSVFEMARGILPEATVIRVSPDYNRSMSRNLGARYALGTEAGIIVFVNLCEPICQWIETLVWPIENGLTDVSYGSYKIVTEDDEELAAALVTIPDEIISPGNLALTSQTVMALGGKQAHLFRTDLDTSEDTELVDFIKEMGDLIRVVSVPAALVTWKPSYLSVDSAFATFRQFAQTDRKARLLFKEQYLPTYLLYVLGFASLVVFPIVGVLAFGAWYGYRLRRLLKEGLWRLVPYGLATIVAVDVARMTGYLEGAE